MEHYIGTKIVSAILMHRACYNEYRGWELPADEDGADEGYLVEYLDGGRPNHKDHAGYISWSPKEQFDNAYQSSGNMSFGHAIEMSKRGRKVARKGWNGKGMWVIYNGGSNGNVVQMAEHSVYASHGLDMVEILPHFDMYTVNAEGRRAMLPGWLASQSDMDAEDWVVLGAED